MKAVSHQPPEPSLHHPGRIQGRLVEVVRGHRRVVVAEVHHVDEAVAVYGPLSISSGL